MIRIPGATAEKTIARLARQLARDLSSVTSDDEFMRRCAGMALAHDLGDDELHHLVRAVDRRLGRRVEDAV